MANEKEDFLPIVNFETLRIIKGISFTSREMEILACIISVRGIKKIASLLSISPKTAETHVRNIMLKLQCNSRESIVDFIEQSGKLSLIKYHYRHLIPQETLTKNLNDKDFPSSSAANLGQLETLSNPGASKILQPPVFEKLQVIPFFSLTLINRPKIWAHALFGGKYGTYKPFKQNAYALALGIGLLITLAAFVYLLILIVKTLHTPSSRDLRSTLDSQKNSGKVINRSAAKVRNITVEPQENTNVKESEIILRNRSSHTTPAKSIPIIRVPFSLPQDTSLLDREDLIQDIAERFSKQGDIQTVALVGLGGAGKTTLARQYERHQEASVAWEINADTKYSLGTSFKDLAYALARTPEQRDELSFIQNIQDLEERGKQILSFVTKTLKENPGWLLIYDNVPTFADIRYHFPTDSALWGSGRVIITTQDLNIENSIGKEKILFIGELTQERRLTLFVKIFHNCEPAQLNQKQKDEALSFLENIPPFPLDISIAAHYMKSHHLSYNEYLSRVSQLSQDFEKSQQLVLKETTDYTKTRYGIITSSLEKLITTNPHFKDLLLVICLLDSQKIPKDLLEFFKNPVIAEDFIQELKKYSLITESLQETSIQTLSLHRNTQAIALSYLMKILKLEKNHHLIEAFVNTLEKYIRNLIDNEACAKMNLIKAHCKKLSRDPSLLTQDEREIINGELGGVYYHLSDFIKARQVLEKSLYLFDKKSDQQSIKAARVSEYLSHVYRQMHKFSEAKTLLEKSLKIYKSDPLNSHTDIIRTLGYLGVIYKGLGNSQKGLSLLKQSLQLCERDPPKSPIIIPIMSGHLGIIYKQQGMYEEAKNLLEKTLTIFDPQYPESIAWAKAHLGDTYRGLGDYKKAKKLIEDSIHLFTYHSPHNPTDIAWVLIYLGRVLKEFGHYQKAKEVYEQSICLFKQYFAERHPTIAQLGVYLGGVLAECGELEKAKEITEKNFAWQKELLPPGHLYLARSSKILGRVYMKLGQFEEAIAALKNAHAGYTKYYGINHSETVRILVLLGESFLLKGDLEKAEEYLEKAHDLYKKNPHTKVYHCLEFLGKVYEKKEEQSFKENDKPQSRQLTMKAIEYFRQALEIVKDKFPDDSPHLDRIQRALSKAEAELKV